MKVLLNEDQKLENLELTIILSNKNEYDKTKFILQEVTPSDEYNMILNHFLHKYSEYLGG